MPIHRLSEQLASQIAAGEVVERPASVVKELVENALDAGASSVNIDIRQGGRELVQVADNGSGIPGAELETAFLRHATSKLESASDLEAIATLGFRGEALAAIAAVSQVTVVSRTADEDAGTRLVLHGGKRESRETVGAPRGTVIAVENLFYNIPARRKFLKSLTTEKRLIDEFVTRYALAYPDVRFRLTHDGRITFHTHGSGAVLDVLSTIYGVDTAQDLLPVAGEGEIRVSGFTGPPSLHRANRSHITLFVNGRWIKDNSLTYAVIQAYHTLLPTGRHPLAVIFIELPFDQVDVNVHPTKTEVRFQDSSRAFAAVQRAVRHTLVSESPVRPVTLGGVRPAEQLAAQWTAGSFSFTRRDDAAGENRPLPEGAPAGENGELPLMRLIGQVGASYIISEGPDGIFLIDQHAAHERILYEQFMAARAEEQIASQGLVTSVTVQLPPEQATLLQDHLDLLGELGFQVEPFGPNAFVVRAIPALLAKVDPGAALAAVVDDLASGSAPLQDELEARIIMRVCKTAAVKAGQTLSRAEMEAMIQQLEACHNPHTCPHGRPTLIHLSAAQLARHFGRT